MVGQSGQFPNSYLRRSTLSRPCNSSLFRFKHPRLLLNIGSCNLTRGIIVCSQQEWDISKIIVNGHMEACSCSLEAVNYRESSSHGSRDFRQALAS
jgi:hypothetical protein